VKIHFKGAARTVTGSKHIVETQDGTKILLDCGMYQGKESNRGKSNRELGFDASQIDYLILSHAHIDHSGLIPLLVKEGFNGPIYCTQPTLDLCEIMLADSAYIQMNDYTYSKKHDLFEENEPLYNIDDVLAALELFIPTPYDEWVHLNDDIALMFTYIGHILGSACINLRIKEGKHTRKLAYTGDIGRENHKIIKGWEAFPQADYIITESTYGDRLHDDELSSNETLLQIIRETCVENKGKLIIPAFSLGRTQELVYSLDQLETEGKIPPVKVFVDSPLSTNATEIVKRNVNHFGPSILKYMERDANPFGFSGLHYIRDVKYSKMINTLKEPCIIISASGMVEAGRILHHVKNNIEDPRNTILMVGYCEPSTIGGRLKDGAETVKIYGRDYKVKARVISIDSYSAHGDYREMKEYLSCQDKQLIKKLFLVHGRFETQKAYKDYLSGEGFYHIEIPEPDEVVELS